MTVRKIGTTLIAMIIGSVLADEMLENELVSLTFDGQGCLTSIRERQSGRELVREKSPFVSVVNAEGKTLVPTSCAKDAKGNLCFGFAEAGEMVLAVRPFSGGWSLGVERQTVQDAQEIHIGRVHPDCLKYRGHMVNAYSDERSFVCVRAYDVGASFRCAEGLVEASVKTSARPLTGARFGFAAGPRSAAIPALRAMTIDADVPCSDRGGAWALGAEACRRSYWMAWGIGPFTIDDEIEQCRRGGFGTLHFDHFFKSYGSYELPGDGSGRDGMTLLKEMIAKAHDAGLHCDFHSLCACVARNDPIATPECQDGLMVTAAYTLGTDLEAATNVTTLVVNEKPVDCHEFETTAWGKSNTLKIGTELVTYTGRSTEAPWTFTGVTRGAFGTTVKPHAKGTKVEYLFNCFSCFQIDADSELAKRAWELQGKLFGAGFDNYYLDGADCIRDKRKTDKFVRELYKAAQANGKTPLFEDSLWTSAAWWFHSRIGANDYVQWGSKRSLDRRFERLVSQARDANFIEPEMGWWATLQGNGAQGNPYRIDEHEYFGRKCAAYDAAMSVLPGNAYPARYMVARNIHRYVTVIGWYERFRLAYAFNDETLAKFRVKRDEYRLRQDTDGVWKVRPLDFFHHRVTGPDARAWRIDSKERREATLRIEALLTCKPWDDPEAKVLLDPACAATFEKSAAKGVTVECANSQDSERGHVVTITANNANATSRGAWSCVARVWPKPPVGQPPVYGDCSGSRGFGLWVRGDGSGALLNVQLMGAKGAGSGPKSEHYQRLDFTGWRYLEFNRRERDSGAASDFVWPYVEKNSSIDYSLERVNVSKLQAVNLYLNEIPAGGKTEVSVSAVKLLPERKQVTYSGLAVTLNGTRYACPFALEPTDFAEMEDGCWTRYDASANPLERAPADLAELRAGTNELTFEGNGGEGVNVRAEVNILALGEPAAALKPTVNAAAHEALAYEVVEPATWAPSKGFEKIPDLVTRPGEKAALSFEVYGPTAPFTLVVGDEARRFDCTLSPKEYLVCRDGEHWQLKRRGEKPCIVASGKIRPFAPFTGSRKVAFSSDDPEQANVFLIFAKHYR
ncbi:MAG TPA: hypothetical protein PLZ74_05785 [Kiritimatiellia bacterium]|nr:hypothetical protein [Kiritimatiellia bacterium]HOR97867.1 hypothetical protein [Kiritimatiellia bacterium]